MRQTEQSNVSAVVRPDGDTETQIDLVPALQLSQFLFELVQKGF